MNAPFGNDAMNSGDQSFSIIVVNDFAHINGGAARIALTSAGALARRGHRVTVFAAVPPIMPELAESGVRVICTGQHEILTDPNRWRASVQGIWNRKAARLMAELLTENDPARTIVHLHGWTKSLSSGVAWATRKKGFPVVCTLHEYFVACPNGGFYNYRTNTICRWRAMSFPCLFSNCDKHGYGQKLWRLVRQTIQRSFGGIPGNIGHFIFISSFSRAIMESYLPGNAAIYDLANPVSMKKPEPAQPEINTGIVAVGRLTPEKGYFLLAEATRKAGLDLTLIGDGELRVKIEQAFPEVRITGWVGESDVIQKVRSARALILPSLWYETQGLVVAEAASQGIPAIVPDSSAARDMITDGKNGLWFKGGDLLSLTDKLERIKDNHLVAAMGRAAYDDFWADPPSMEKHIRQLEMIYRRVLKLDLP